MVVRAEWLNISRGRIKTNQQGHYPNTGHTAQNSNHGTAGGTTQQPKQQDQGNPLLVICVTTFSNMCNNF